MHLLGQCLLSRGLDRDPSVVLLSVALWKYVERKIVGRVDSKVVSGENVHELLSISARLDLPASSQRNLSPAFCGVSDHSVLLKLPRADFTHVVRSASQRCSSSVYREAAHNTLTKYAAHMIHFIGCLPIKLRPRALMACINSSYSAPRNSPFNGCEALLAHIQPNDYNLRESRLASLANIQQP